jgi:hypothetical protein
MSKRLAEDMRAIWTWRTGIPTTVLRPVMILTGPALLQNSETETELGAVVHANDVTTAVLRALAVTPNGHIRLTLCSPGQFDSTATRQVLGWTPSRGWPPRDLSAWSLPARETAQETALPDRTDVRLIPSVGAVSHGGCVPPGGTRSSRRPRSSSRMKRFPSRQ